MNPNLYEKDFYAWVQQTSEALRTREWDAVDLEHLLEEVESLGIGERRALYSNLKVVLLHLLKWKYQPRLQSNSWRSSIKEHRKRINRQLKESPSLKPYLQEIFAECYEDARDQAQDETGLEIEVFPQECPFTLEQVQDLDFWPE